MTPEEKELFKRSIALSEENNDILRSIQSSMRLARFMTLLHWVVIIGLSLGAFYYIKPYLESAMTLYGGAKGQVNEVTNILNTLKSSVGL